MYTEFEDIKEELDVYGINVKICDEVKSKCVDICRNHNLSGEQLAIQWLTYAASNNCDELTIDHLDNLERSFLAQKRKSSKISSDAPTSDDVKLSIHSCDENLLAAYTGSPSTASDKSGSRVNSGHSLTRRSLLEDAFSSSLAPSLSQSPQSQKSQKYSERTNSGHVVASSGCEKEWPAATVAHGRCEVKQLPTCGGQMLTSSFKFMFDKLRDCAEVLDDAVFEFGNKILESNEEVEEFSRLNVPSNSSLWFLGRVCCDSVGKLNAASVMLQGDREYGDADVVRLDLSNLASYSLFPGQIVAVKGINSSGQSILAQQTLCCLSEALPTPVLPASIPSFEVHVACGPFTTTENLLYEPLTDLLRMVTERPPDVLLLLGPLLDSSHPSLDDPLLEDSYDSILQRILAKLETAVSGAPTKVYLVTSYRDICCFPVYPTPPVFFSNVRTPSPVSLLPDPCLLDVNGVCFGITTVDYPMHVSREEISFSSKTGDRLARLSEHMLHQRSFYPVYPAPEGVPLNLEQAEIHGRLPVTPHVMVTPSDFKGYCKDVSGCLFVNPERMVKGKAGGCFSRLRLCSTKDGKLDIKAQIVKI